MEDVKSAFKLLGWYVVATYLFLPLLAAPFTGGQSLTLYFGPFIEPRGVLLILAPAVLIWVIHLFVLYTVLRPFKRKYLAPPQYY